MGIKQQNNNPPDSNVRPTEAQLLTDEEARGSESEKDVDKVCKTATPSVQHDVQETT